jgi:hypothetical protein
MAKTEEAESSKASTKAEQPLTCGLIMPISPLDGRTAEHWLEVRAIITDAIQSIAAPKFSVRLVSDADEIGIIQKRIVQNVYSSDIVVVDASAKNPNVMFELGMRLAFDKPVVIVKDDETDYSFDTSIIEHLTYPRDLRFGKVVVFKDALAAKVLHTYRAGTVPNSSPFLKSFGEFRVATLEQTEVPANRLVVDMLEELRGQVARLGRAVEREPLAPHVDALSFRVKRSRARAMTFVRNYLGSHAVDPLDLMADRDFLAGVYAYANSNLPDDDFHEIVVSTLRAVRNEDKS